MNLGNCLIVNPTIKDSSIDTCICDEVSLIENIGAYFKLALKEPSIQLLLEGGTDFRAIAIDTHSAKDNSEREDNSDHEGQACL